MSESVELSTFDLRYEGHRLRDDAREARLLASIVERGIEEPLEGVDPSADCRFLLNGFKRYRCAKKLGLGCVPYVSLGQDEAAAARMIALHPAVQRLRPPAHDWNDALAASR